MSTSAHPNHVVRGNRPPGKGRGASNTNDRGNTDTRRARKAWLIETYQANVAYIKVTWGDGEVDVGAPSGFGCLDAESAVKFFRVEYGDEVSVEIMATCRCYRCGKLLTIDTVTVDKIFTKPEGGTYRTPTQDRREKATNIRPACNDCNSTTGAAIASQSRSKKK